MKIPKNSIQINSRNVRELDNYVLYRVWNEATTKRERSLAMKEIKRRQREGNMVVGNPRKTYYYDVQFDSAKWERGFGSGNVYKERLARIFKTKEEAEEFIKWMHQRNNESDLHKLVKSKTKIPYFSNIKVQRKIRPE